MTLKQVQFATEYLETGNATEAAMQVYEPKNRNTAHSIGSENLRKPAIRAYLSEKAADAAAMIYELSQKSEHEGIRLRASMDILDRAGYFVNKSGAAEDEKQLPKPIYGGNSIVFRDYSGKPPSETNQNVVYEKRDIQ